MTTTFADLGLAAPLLKALEEEGYTKPTPIQSQAIGPVMEGRDLLGIAQTGTGKTAAFALPILHRLAADRRPAPRKGCRALILSPTRELASQIGESFRAYGRHLGFTVAVVFGGVAPRPQIQALSRGVDVLVAAPGRLLDHMGERHADISGTEIFVLDEADQMLDLGFVKPIRRIVSHLSMRRQNLFFSATMPNEIAGLANELLNNPVKVAVTPVSTTAERVSQRVILIEAAKKRTVLAELLAKPEMKRTLVFTRTKRGADRVARHLETAGQKVAAIHGNKSQRQREDALASFRTGAIDVLVATDIAARGIDVDLVSHVVNYELPEVPEAYVHRIGRTARAGATGEAISLCDNEERDLLRAIERVTRQDLPKEDRRNDQSIAAAPRSEGARHADGAPGERGARHNGGRNGQHRGRDGAHRGRDGHRGGRGEGHRGRDGDRSEARPNGEGRSHGEARFGGERRADGEQRRDGARNGPGHHRQGETRNHEHRSEERGGRGHGHHGHSHGNGGHRGPRSEQRSSGRRDGGANPHSDPSSIGGVAFLKRPQRAEGHRG